MIALLIALGIGAIITGTVISTIGAVHQAQAEADAAEMQAENLAELSSEGGYYDQVLTALQTELDDIEADRADAATALALTTSELVGEIGVSKLQEAASVAGQAIQGLETARAGAEAQGQIGAAAGAGGVSVRSGSVLQTAAAVGRAVGRRVSATNLGIQATRLAGALQRDILQNNILRAQMSYQDMIRGLNTREAQVTAQTTMQEFQQETGGEQAEYLQTQADWIREWGVPLTVVGGVAQGLGQIASLGIGRTNVPQPSGSMASTYNFTSGGSTIPGYGQGNPFEWTVTPARGGGRASALSTGSY